MSVGEYTASSIAMDIDAKEEEKDKKANATDYSQLQREIEAATTAAKQVSTTMQFLLHTNARSARH